MGGMKNGATGVFEVVGNGWQPINLSRSLKWVASENTPVTEENVLAGAMMLPLRLGYIGHEGTCQRISDCEQIRSAMTDTVTQVYVHCQAMLSCTFHHGIAEYCNVHSLIWSRVNASETAKLVPTGLRKST